jgi:hypothetical protein
MPFLGSSRHTLVSVTSPPSSFHRETLNTDLGCGFAQIIPPVCGQLSSTIAWGLAGHSRRAGIILAIASASSYLCHRFSIMRIPSPRFIHSFPVHSFATSYWTPYCWLRTSDERRAGTMALPRHLHLELRAVWRRISCCRRALLATCLSMLAALEPSKDFLDRLILASPISVRLVLSFAPPHGRSGIPSGLSKIC